MGTKSDKSTRLFEKMSLLILTRKQGIFKTHGCVRILLKGLSKASLLLQLLLQLTADLILLVVVGGPRLMFGPLPLLELLSTTTIVRQCRHPQ